LIDAQLLRRGETLGKKEKKKETQEQKKKAQAQVNAQAHCGLEGCERRATPAFIFTFPSVKE